MMPHPSGDDQPTSVPTAEPAPAPAVDISIDAQAGSFSHQVVLGQGTLHHTQNIYEGRSWLHSDEIMPQETAEAQRGFVEPPGYSSAWHTLTTRGVLVICAPANTGKRTAALNLLAELRHPQAERAETQPRPDLGVRELDHDWPKPTVSELPLFVKQALLLDLSARSQQGEEIQQAPNADFGAKLLGYAHKLVASESFLIILTTAREWAACAESTRELTVDVWGYPQARQIIAERLEHSPPQHPHRVAWLDLPKYHEVLARDVLPRDAIALYRAIVDAEDSPEGKADAIDQFHGWRSYLTDWWADVNGEHGPYERAMQIVAATIGNAPAADVLTLTDNFLRAAKHEADVHSPLAGPDLSARLDRTGISAHGDLLVLEPTRHQFSGAALDHVWRERPQIQGLYKQWIAHVIKDQTGKKYVKQIAASFTGMGIRRKSIEFIELIENWVKDNSDQDALATQMLDDTCLDPVVGARVRTKMLAWADQKTTSERLVDIVIAVCQGELGYQRTALALLRLKKILLRTNASAFTGKVAEAIVAIAHHPDRRRMVLSEVIGWMGDTNPVPGRVGFLALMTPGEQSLLAQLMTDCRGDDVLRNQLTDAWHILMYANPGDRQIAEAVGHLLTFANTMPELIDTIVGIIGPAIKGDLKAAIAGQVLYNSAIGEDGDSARAKLLTLLLDEPPRGVAPAPEPVEPAGDEVPLPSDPTDDVWMQPGQDMDDDTGRHAAANDDAPPQETSVQAAGETVAETDEHAGADPVSGPAPSARSFDAFAPHASPDTPTAEILDNDPEDKPRRGRFWR